MITESYKEDLQIISEEEYYTSTYTMFNKDTLNCTDFNQLCYFTNFICCPTQHTNISLAPTKLNPINFNALNDLETDSEFSEEEETQETKKKYNHTLKPYQNGEFPHKKLKKTQNFDETTLGNKSQVNGHSKQNNSTNLKETNPNISRDEPLIINNEAVLQGHYTNVDTESEIVKEKQGSSKKKNQSLKNGQTNKDEETQSLTQYQKKKILIQQLKEANVLLDWDNYKKDDLLYEYWSTQSGTQRRRKGKYSEIDIIDLPTPNFDSRCQLNSSTNLIKDKETNKRFKQNAKSSSQDLVQQIQSVNFTSDDSDTVENTQAKVLKKQVHEDGPIIEMVEVDAEELKRRQEDFRSKQFKLGRCTIPCNITLVSSQVQAVIPQIRPIDEVRKTWVLQDLDSLLQFKNSPEYDSLEQYMNQAFGARKEEEVFNILKLNKFDLKASIDYCNFQRDFLVALYKSKDEEKKKKMNNKRKLEKRNYI